MSMQEENVTVPWETIVFTYFTAHTSEMETGKCITLQTLLVGREMGQEAHGARSA